MQARFARKGDVHIHIAKGGAPIYQQIVNQVKYLVASGRLAPGEELPPIRTHAEQLRVKIDRGRVVFCGELDEIKERHRRLTLHCAARAEGRRAHPHC